ncbi:MAG: hypothetical protein A3C30_04195 [Candidatus Levybacteria bacterium RIFCSPHIGHO2_02_FULL_40_18]|nr:MAG: hypothetical protein A2869_01470 [Candidatus Levybacteria bacterium RIFCSPHIGHO2_01_FULL_40_58]OGH26282.1 MAG: hypothetical protein A3C30_04195 [Candidatus Levybacteria bacterium RIFCSPHIGHO2_02_FULL_40_18]OGH31241.1 MAG: hypothetical protein A3E43_02450 [Candidatus Levybacteria bacterium RIFCSPHIGHO2_12_FULL_40_31]OGH39811.1 MAG: hypothetical protein A2894_02975 [Candidatus Levybacteria bacterium RIFCSPLOWO2_01_FULL_40_64]OGH49128.1 MAG: hypothetical protein A3I54_00980 [Candidatus Lev
MILIFVTFENREDAEKVSDYLIKNKLAACIETFPVQSHYYWKGEKINTQEFSGIIKTDDGYFNKVRTALEKIFPYEIPQIIEVKAGNVNKSYLRWLEESLK